VTEHHWVQPEGPGIPYFERYELPYIYEHWPEQEVWNQEWTPPPGPDEPTRYHHVLPWPFEEENPFTWPPDPRYEHEPLPEWRYPPA
jgi:hypothetical protein